MTDIYKEIARLEAQAGDRKRAMMQIKHRVHQIIKSFVKHVQTHATPTPFEACNDIIIAPSKGEAHRISATLSAKAAVKLLESKTPLKKLLDTLRDVLGFEIETLEPDHQYYKIIFRHSGKMTPEQRILLEIMAGDTEFTG